MSADPVRWLTPAPLWTKVPEPGVLDQPWIVSLATEAFFDVFQAIVGGTSGRSPAELATNGPGRDGGGAVRLKNPTDHVYNLITASLVCRRVGIPDHAVNPRRGESAAFVMRRLESSGHESGLVADGSWLPATPDALVPGEQRYPLHALAVAPFAAPGTVAATLGMALGQKSVRAIQYGYLPVTGAGKAGGFGRSMVVRTVLLRDPCPAVLSAPTAVFSIDPPPSGDATAKEATP